MKNTTLIFFICFVSNLTDAAFSKGNISESILVDQFPFVIKGNTSNQETNIDHYSCNTSFPENGPEVIYQFTVLKAGHFSAIVSGDIKNSIDNDIHLLKDLTLSSKQAVNCITRGDQSVSAHIDAGTYYLVIDTWQYASGPLPGEYQLSVDFFKDGEISERIIANGVIWKSHRYDTLYGGTQSWNTVEIDMTHPDVEVKPGKSQSGCEKVYSMGQRIGAIAGINGGFFDGTCKSLNLLRIDDTQYFYNSYQRTAIGIFQDKSVAFERVAANETWINALIPKHALGGIPRIVRNGQVSVEDSQEGVTTNFATARHPRTAVGYNPTTKTIALVTFDGRTNAGIGVTLEQLADFFITKGYTEAMNLDGGGSTTLWMNKYPFQGVVNFPSDNAKDDHEGARSVPTGLFVFSTPYNYMPRWYDTPEDVHLNLGETFSFQITALDNNISDILSYTLIRSPKDMTINKSSGDISWTIPQNALKTNTIEVQASDGKNTITHAFTVYVSGGNDENPISQPDDNDTNSDDINRYYHDDDNLPSPNIFINDSDDNISSPSNNSNQNQPTRNSASSISDNKNNPTTPNDTFLKDDKSSKKKGCNEKTGEQENIVFSFICTIILLTFFLTRKYVLKNITK